MQGQLGILAVLLQVIPEHRRPLSRLDGHAQVGEGCEASDKTGEIEHQQQLQWGIGVKLNQPISHPDTVIPGI